MSILTCILCVVIGIFVAACIIANSNDSKLDNAMHDLYAEQARMRS